MSVELEGAAALRRRLAAIGKVPPEIAAQWAVEASKAMKRRIPVRTGETAASVRPGSRRRKTGGVVGGVVGSRVVNFIDAGSVAHDIPRSRFTKTGRLRRGKAAGTGKVLKFDVGGQTIFRKRVHKRAIAARPLKVKSILEGLDKVHPLREIVKRWDRAA